MSTFIVAELSANHRQDKQIARDTISAMAESGADAVKFQTFTPDTITLDVRNEYFTVSQGTIWDGQTLHDLYQGAYLPYDWHAELAEHAESLGLIWFSAPFDPGAVDFLEKLGCPIYKIASFEITDTPLIAYAASKGKPMIISTGVAEIGDIQAAVDACRVEGNVDVTILQCTSSYPAPVEDANLRMIPNLMETFGVKAGLSDHTSGHAVALAAVVLGAHVVEKHFILDRSLGGPDASFSMEPREFAFMVEQIRLAEKALGSVDYALSEKKKQNRELARSLFVVQDIEAGAAITAENVRSVRPGHGLSPAKLQEVLGRKVRRSVQRGTPLTYDLFE